MSCGTGRMNTLVLSLFTTALVTCPSSPMYVFMAGFWRYLDVKLVFNCHWITGDDCVRVVEWIFEMCQSWWWWDLGIGLDALAHV